MGLAVEKELVELFRDCDPGAIPAIGAAYRIDTIVDESLLQQPDVYFEAGDHEALVHVKGPAFGAMMTARRTAGSRITCSAARAAGGCRRQPRKWHEY